MTTFVLLTFLLCIQPVKAQGGGYPGGGYPGGGYPGGDAYGYWQVTGAADGTNKLDEFDPQGKHYHQGWPWQDPNSESVWESGFFHRPNGWSDTTESKGTLTCQFDYLDDFGLPADPPFGHTWVKKTGSAFWHGNGDPSDSNGTASDGLGDPEIPTDDGNGGTSSGTHYEKKDTGGGSFTVVVSPQASVGCSTSTNSSAETMGYENTSFTAVDVGLPLISSIIDASTKKGGAPNTRASSGSLTADCAAVYDSISGMWRGATDLSCSSPFDDPLYTWHANGGTPSVYDETNNLGITSQFLGSISIDMGLCPHDTGLPMTTTVGPQVVSQSDPSASDQATYTITWHAPYEKISEALDIEGANILETRFSGVSPSGFGSAPESKSGHIPSELYVEGALIGFALAGQEEMVGLLEVCCHICNVVDFVKDYAEEPPFTNGNRNDGTSWHVAQGLGHVPPEYANDPDGWTHCTMSWCRVAHWTDVHYDCDKYGPHGWVAGGPYDQHYKHVYSVADEPFFTSSGPGGSGGTGGSGGGGAE